MTPDTMFKFVNVRPAQRTEAPPSRFAVFKRSNTDFQTALGQLAGDDVQSKSIALAVRFLGSDAYLKSDPPLGQPIPMLKSFVSTTAREPTAAAARQKAAGVLGRPLADWLALPETVKLKAAIWDSALAHFLSPATTPNDRDAVFANVRAMHAAEYLAGLPDKAPPLTETDINALRIVFPKTLVPPATRPGADAASMEMLAGLKAKGLAAFDKVSKLQQAAGELRTAATTVRKQRQRSLPIKIEGDVNELTPIQIKAAGAASSLLGRTQILAEMEKMVSKEVIIQPAAKPWVFEAGAARYLSAGTRELLAPRQEALGERTAGEIAHSLEMEAREQATAFLKSVPAKERGRMAEEEHFVALAKVAALPFSLPFKKSPAPAINTPEKAGLRPLGVGDLLVVKQKLLRYEAGEVAHIENVLKSEKMGRVHSRLRETEETIVLETEELEETEKDQQSTERFELHKEAEKSVESSMTFDAGVAVTASYGPVSLSAHADFALSNSVSESSKTASTFAREVTERSVSKIQRRAREERTRRTLERFEEKNEHGFDNTLGPGNITGVYRWVDKYYRARVVNYGRRLMLEFIIPEPAAFYLWVTSNRPLPGITLPRPSAPTIYGRPLEPDDLNANNYSQFISAYNVQDATAYPEESIKISAAVKVASTKENGNATIAEVSEKLVCPNGYEVDDVYGVSGSGGWSGNWVDIKVGGESWGSVVASDVEGIVPISIIGWTGCVHVNVVAICSLKEEAIRSWQLKTYASIMTAYDRALAAYNEQVAAARIQQGVAIEGRNPLINRKLERDELRKAALRALTNDFDTLVIGSTVEHNIDFHAMRDNGDFGYPEFSPKRAHYEGQVIQFFEQAFEWNNMVYRFYPYFWGRKVNWDDRYPLTDVDPMFTDFLRAGAARVVVPVHPAYPEAVLHFLHTAEIWNGGVPPTIDDPLYVSIIDELRSDAQVNDDGDDLAACSLDSTTPCFVDEWEVKLPTTLVYLQKDSDLPVFSTGETTPANIIAKLDEMVIASGEDLDWRHSIVDLLKLLGRDSGFAARKAMALSHGCPTSGSLAMNSCLRKKIMAALVANGGVLPNDF